MSSRHSFPDPTDAPRLADRPDAIAERMANFERGLGRIHAAVAEDLATLTELTNRIDMKVTKLGQLQSEHHFILTETLQQAPAANRHLGDLHRSLAERMASEHTQLQDSRMQVAQELDTLSKAAGELRQMVNDVLPETYTASDRALQNLASLADQIETERTDFSAAMQAALQEHQEGQRWMVLATAIGGALTSALVTLSLVVGMKYMGWFGA